MALAIFDLDNTLIAGDSDHLWGEFLCDQGLVDASWFREANDQFHADYQRGELDIHAYLEFALSPMIGRSLASIAALQAQFMRDAIEPILLDKAAELVETHRTKGDALLIITATNELVTRPIADRLGIDDLLGCEVDVQDNKITGKATGILTYREGKVARLEQWLEQPSAQRVKRKSTVGRDTLMEPSVDKVLAGASFYSDSHNDLPLLERVGRPVAVDADDKLSAIARSKAWEQISLRG